MPDRSDYRNRLLRMSSEMTHAKTLRKEVRCRLLNFASKRLRVRKFSLNYLSWPHFFLMSIP